MEQQAPATEMTSEQVDSLVNDIESKRDTEQNEIPMSVEQGDKPQSNVQALQDLEIDWKGKATKIPHDKIKDYVSKGYDYEVKMAEFNRNRALQASQLKSEIEQQYKNYIELYKLAENNPEWWEKVNNEYQAAIGNAKQQSDIPETNDPVVKSLYEKIQSLEEQLNGFSSVKEKIELQERQAIEKQEDELYLNTLNEVKNEYPEINFDKPSLEDGQTLEFKVLKYASENGIKNFKTAFKDFYFDEIVKLREQKVKENIAKETQKRTKLGLSVSDTPKNNLNNLKYKQTNNRNYQDSDSILRELGMK
jgi:hypothetical protein